MPYEIKNVKKTGPYDGIKADMFTVGEILFTMLFKCFPFEMAIDNDPFYKMIKNNRTDKLIAIYEQINSIELSEELKSLLILLLSHNP